MPNPDHQPLLSEQKHTAEQEKSKFEYSPENPPPLDVLRKNIFLVHATSSIPEQDLLRAQARDNTREKKWGENKPPSFRPTLHFSMGELFSGGWEGGFSRETMPYAVLLPLQTCEQQLFSVFPNDTIIMGDVRLDESCTIVIPEGQKYEGNAQVVKYNTDAESLREAVNRSITETDAWQMHTDTFIDGPHSFASRTSIEDVEVGDKRFFTALLQEYPQLSYGSHFHSEKGNAWRMGVIDYRIADIINRYSDTLQNQIPTPELSIWRNLILHNLELLDTTLASASYSDEIKTIYENEKAELNSWLNIVDADLYARKHYGKTITSAKTKIWKEIRDKKDNPEEIRATLDHYREELHDSQDYQTNIREIADVLANMPRDEFETFLSENKESLAPKKYNDLKIFFAVKRWLIIKSEHARSEGLEIFLLTAIQDDPKAIDTIFEELKVFLTSECNRIDDAFDILRLQPVLAALSKKWNVEIRDLKNLSNLLKICPATSSLFRESKKDVTFENVEPYQFLQEIGEYTPDEIENPAQYKSFLEAEFAARNKEYQLKRMERLLEEIKTPMNTARDQNQIGLGETMTYYEILKRDNKNLETFWNKIGLSEQFRKHFSTDEGFWNSDFSMLDIYKMLKSEKDKKN